VPAHDQVDWLREAIRGRDRLDRVPADIPVEFTWRYKSRRIAEALGLGFDS
jgi:hypothetical protein